MLGWNCSCGCFFLFLTVDNCQYTGIRKYIFAVVLHNAQHQEKPTFGRTKSSSTCFNVIWVSHFDTCVLAMNVKGLVDDLIHTLDTSTCLGPQLSLAATFDSTEGFLHGRKGVKVGGIPSFAGLVLAETLASIHTTSGTVSVFSIDLMVAIN